MPPRPSKSPPPSRHPPPSDRGSRRGQHARQADIGWQRLRYGLLQQRGDGLQRDEAGDSDRSSLSCKSPVDPQSHASLSPQGGKLTPVVKGDRGHHGSASRSGHRRVVSPRSGTKLVSEANIGTSRDDPDRLSAAEICERSEHRLHRDDPRASPKRRPHEAPRCPATGRLPSPPDCAR